MFVWLSGLVKRLWEAYTARRISAGSFIAIACCRSSTMFCRKGAHRDLTQDAMGMGDIYKTQRLLMFCDIFQSSLFLSENKQHK